MWPKGEFLSVREAAERTGKDPETIRRWIWKGKLHAVKAGGQYLIAPSALDDAVYFQDHAGTNIGEPVAEYAVKPEEFPTLTPEERLELEAKRMQPVEWDDVEGDLKLAEEIFRAHGYIDVVQAVREAREALP